MPLPVNGLAWPPKELQQILPTLRIWDAWYTGNPDKLAAAYGGATANDPTSTGFFASDKGGFKATVGRALNRWFWGEATRGPDRRLKLHVPIAADMCQASADLLFADEVTLTVDDETTQAVLEDLAGDGLYTKLAEAAEIGAGLGGVYLRVTWDQRIADAPFVTSVDSDQAWPEFKWDRLQAVTFWQVVSRDGKTVFRHLERHELAPDGTGIILHGLYQGEEDNLGHAVPLTDVPATAGLADLVDELSTISTESPGLAVVYVPNQRPQRNWRTDAVGKSLGRSDLDGVESLMDALDETYSSWMRDLRLGKARIMVARSLLEANTKGSGMSFDAEQEVYAPVQALGSANQSLGDMVEQVQFNIRVTEHQQTAAALVDQILRTAGYSTQTFGEGDTGNIRTATEVEQRERRSLMTRDRKIRLWRPAIADVAEKLLWVNKVIFNADCTPSRPDVSFPDGVQETQLVLAQTAQALSLARAASTETLVEMVHPDWTDDKVTAEVAKITAEDQAAAQPPAGMDPAGNPFVTGQPPSDATGSPTY